MAHLLVFAAPFEGKHNAAHPTLTVSFPVTCLTECWPPALFPLWHWHSVFQVGIEIKTICQKPLPGVTSSLSQDSRTQSSHPSSTRSTQLDKECLSLPWLVRFMDMVQGQITANTLLIWTMRKHQYWTVLYIWLEGNVLTPFSSASNDTVNTHKFKGNRQINKPKGQRVSFIRQGNKNSF